MSIRALDINQKRYLAGLLELACQQLEITKTQYDDAKNKYEAVGNWLSDSPEFKLSESAIFPQGSMRIGTTVRPFGRDEFDIDLVCHLVYGTISDPTDVVRKLVGDRLRENGIYRNMLEPLNRGWRLNYAESSKFHLDITPSIHNPACINGGLLVPDKVLKEWKPSHPKGYAEWFDVYAKLQPRGFLSERIVLKADIEPLPDQIPIKGLLKRIVQIAKRHRDLMFTSDRNKRAPISIIITTLAAHAYAYAVRNNRYVHELDLIYDVVSNMDRFIHVDEMNGKRLYTIENPSTKGENFAEKWNVHSERAKGFYAWQQQALNDLDRLAEIEGLDSIIEHLKTRLIGPEATRVMNLVTNRLGRARSAGILRVAPAAGLGLTTGQSVRANTFYGA